MQHHQRIFVRGEPNFDRVWVETPPQVIVFSDRLFIPPSLYRRPAQTAVLALLIIHQNPECYCVSISSHQVPVQMGHEMSVTGLFYFAPLATVFWAPPCLGLQYLLHSI